MLLDDRVVIVSGIGPGLGQELALAAARENAAGIVLAARTESYLKDVEAAVNDQYTSRTLVVPTDIAQRDQCRRLVEATISEFGRIDTLINSAYTPGQFGLFEDADLESWRVPMEVNLFGSLGLTQAVVPHMKRAGGGAIVFINTMVHKKPLETQGAYASSKGALTAASKILAKEIGPHGIRVNSVYMGWMWGPPVESYVQAVAREQGVRQEEIIAGITQDIPLGAIPDDADCANAAIFLASDYARVITGASLDVNGGEWMP
jgi:NAD(P)-dependent dehydrogenase (short-subunit alcohol dehydrogenase family)